MDLTNLNGLWILKVDMIQAVAFAVLTYYFGTWLKTKVQLLRRYSVSSPVVGGICVAITLSILEGMGILRVEFDTTLQKQLMLAFFTTIGLMASLKVVKQGGKLLVGFLVAVSVLCALQNVLGMTLADWMGLDKHYGILAGSVSMMGGLGTSAAFGPYFEQTYGITGGTAVAITAATFGMAAALMIGGPFGEWLIRRFKIKTAQPVANPEPELRIPDDLDTDITGNHAAQEKTLTEELMKATAVIVLCMALGSVVSGILGQFVTLPAYIGSMIVAAVVRNVGDFSKKYTVEGKGLNALADMSLVLFVTMAINSLKLHELIDLALPLAVILAAQTLLMLIFAYFVLFAFFGKNYDAVLLTVGGIGFSMGATANGLANMQALAEKYGFSPRPWLIVSLVGAFLIDFVNAILITWFGTF
ncbi:MAG: sodium/glutamate symporter [Burkholderiaceae bacterium]|nr:sodium/glutamate symporter [Burkholderiaceae bacterium]